MHVAPVLRSVRTLALESPSSPSPSGLRRPCPAVGRERRCRRGGRERPGHDRCRAAHLDRGYLDTQYDADLFCIHLSAVPPAGLPIVQLQCVVNTVQRLSLDAAGNGVFANETCQAGGKTILAPNWSLPAGTYYVAVSYYGWQPISGGGPIWAPGVPGQRAPDGPGAAGALIGWGGAPVVQPSNPYWINLGFMSSARCRRRRRARRGGRSSPSTVRME